MCQYLGDNDQQRWQASGEVGTTQRVMSNLAIDYNYTKGSEGKAPGATGI